MEIYNFFNYGCKILWKQVKSNQKLTEREQMKFELFYIALI